MSSPSALLLLVAGSAAVAGVARRYRLSAPLLLVLAGLGAAYLPGLPDYSLDPEIVLPLVLPPLLYTAAQDASYRSLRRNVRPVALLSIGYVLFCTLTMGLVAHALIPSLPLPAAFVLGAVIAPPDAVAATAIARRVGLPSQLVSILQGESLVNDATAITAYRVAVAAAVGEGFSFGSALGEFLLAALGGTAVGLAVMWPLQWLRSRLRDPLLLNTFSLLVPFAAYAAAEAFDASGVIAVVVVGLYLGHYANCVDFELRLQEEAVWKMVAFVLESAVFALIGLQLPVVVRQLKGYTAGQLTVWVAVLLVALIGLRFVWSWPATYLPSLLSRRVREREGRPPWTRPFIVSWAGMRGVVSLAVAFSIPVTTHDGSPFPDRDLLLFLVFALVIGTLLVQGLTLPGLVRRLRLPRPDPQAETLREAQAQYEASAQAEARLDALLEDPRNRLPEALEARLRRLLDRRRNSVWERMGAPVHESTGESVDSAYRRLTRETLAAERQALVALRAEDRLDDEMLRRLVRRLDFEEALMVHTEE
ncbi:Na+/H+ antiporter [Streptacidiphilus rugosus]|uniref:Na+/H+ antiporter n=1 Tax=Streptacidiphilus rugosus TaxID=405783 RepID=UPI00055DCB84|nr:Na+/H+ antiporter [Streptacidiphilus rugosus]